MGMGMIGLVPLTVAAALGLGVPEDGAGEVAATDAAQTPGERSSGSAKENGPMVRLALLGGAGVVRQDGVDEPYGAGFLELDIDPAGIGLYVGGTFAVARHLQTYTVREPVVQNVASWSQERPEEHWLDTRVTIAYDVLHTVTDEVAFRIGLAPRISQYLIDGFDHWFFAPEVYTRLGASFGDRVDIWGDFGFAPAVTGAEDTRSVDGLPQFVYDYGFGVAVDLTDDGMLRLDVRWRSHTTVYELVERGYHGGLAGLRLEI